MFQDPADVTTVLSVITTFAAAFVAAWTAAGATVWPPVVSPEPNPDGGITFRCHAPNAQRVVLNGDWKDGKGKELAKGEGGVWSITLAPIAPGIYTYSFDVDGMNLPDRANPRVNPGQSVTASLLEIARPLPHIEEFDPNIPHGEVRVVSYASKQTDSIRRMHVYTPPGYEADPAKRWPVLYLLHGYTGDDESWTVYGRAHWIADNLIAGGGSQPLAIVMPDDHVKPLPPRQGDPDYVNTNSPVCDRHLIDEVLPFVEKRYRVRTDPDGRAVAGLSMGAEQTAYTALAHPELFAWVGAFAPGARLRDDPMEPLLDGAKQHPIQFRLFVLTCGRQDGFLENDTRLSQRLRASGVNHEFQLVDGAHDWDVFRSNLAHFLMRVFQPPKK